MSIKTQLKDLRKINKAGVLEATRKADTIRKRAINAFLRSESTFEVQDILNKGYKDFLTKSMMIAYAKGYAEIEKEALTAQSLKLSLDDDLKSVLDSLKTLDSVEELQEQLSTRALQVVEGTSAKVEKKLRGVLNELILEGATRKTGVKRLENAFSELGLSPENNYTIENIFRTQTQLVYGAAKDHAEQRPQIQEILYGHKYLTVGDNRVRPEHEVWENVVFVKDNAEHQALLDTWYPPNGYSCRCMVVALFRRPPGRLKQPPSTTPVIDSNFSFRPGRILTPPKEQTLVAPEPTISLVTTFADIAKSISGSPSGLTVKVNGQITVKKPANLIDARQQLEEMKRLLAAAEQRVESVIGLPKNDPERVKAALALQHAIKQYKRVINNVKRLLN